MIEPKEMEKELIRQSERIKAAKAANHHAKAEKLRAEYRALHRKWMAVKDQTRMEI